MSAVGLPVVVLGLWLAVHTFPGLGPIFADGLRAVVGAERVARLEEFAYGLQDDFNRWWRADEAPKSYWEVPAEGSASTPAPLPASSGSGSAEVKPPKPPFAPANVGAMLKQLSAKGDGTWVSVADPANPSARPLMAKTLIHPDPKRPWAELFVLAIDVHAVELHLVAGTREPKANTAEGRAYTRSGVMAPAHYTSLMLAFNGGFKATHGQWGTHVDGVTLLSARKHGCTVLEKNGELHIQPYMATAADNALLEGARWWRQTPPCMFENNKRHGGLWDPESKNWGAAIGGDSIIRRSAIGLDEKRNVLFVGVSNNTAAQALADGMHHAGASDVAQLDVNWSFPKVVVFTRNASQTPVGTPLFPGFEVGDGEYVTTPSERDFFYMTRKAESAE